MALSPESLHVAVVGSINLDIVARVPRFPRPGETLSGARISHFPGGKGGNQALAAHRLGARVSLVACIGDDLAAEDALTTLKSEGVDLTCCTVLHGETTGHALILVSDDGENQIVVAPGANAAFRPEHLRLPAADAVIAQLEVPMQTILAAAAQHRGLFCLNAAPARPVPAELLDRVDLLVVNEIEAQAIGDGLAEYRGLLATTYGRRGAKLSRDGELLAHAKPPEVKAIDTVGAGDAFTAALTVLLAAGWSPGAALELACRAGALATTRRGAQASPTAAELGL